MPMTMSTPLPFFLLSQFEHSRGPDGKTKPIILFHLRSNDGEEAKQRQQNPWLHTGRETSPSQLPSLWQSPACETQEYSYQPAALLVEGQQHRQLKEFFFFGSARVEFRVSHILVKYYIITNYTLLLKHTLI